ncbi:MAG TPA: hypothetical protein VGU69_07315 [Rhizomicrobium sp.]|nr:hypothetical protein [Rhizomicrobium sp.]
MTDPALDTSRSMSFGPAHSALLRKTDIQFSFESLKRPEDPEWLRRFLIESWPFVKWTLIGIAAVIGVAIVYMVVRHFWGRTWNGRRSPVRDAPLPEEAWRPTAAQARQLLEESDALAREGRYAEAVHLLLLRSIEDFDKWRPRVVRRASTSREIGLFQSMPDAARTVFRRIADVVERALFGGGQVDAETFAHCRADYESFALPPVWQNGAGA